MRISGTIVLAFFLTSIGAPIASAADTAHNIFNRLDEREQKIILRPCDSLDSSDKPRCIARQISRLKLDSTRSTPTGAFDVYDGFDLGRTKLRTKLQQERKDEFARDARKRTTYRQFTPTNDINTRRRPYINDLRQRRLDCMLVDPGRPRRLCFDALTGDARTMMKEQKASKQYPAR